MATLKIVDFTDSINTCDCCGKTELSGTYVMANEAGDICYYGKVCGARAAGVTPKELTDTVKGIKTKAELFAAAASLFEVAEAAKTNKYARPNEYAERALLGKVLKMGNLATEFLMQFGRPACDPLACGTKVISYGAKIAYVNNGTVRIQ